MIFLLLIELYVIVVFVYHFPPSLFPFKIMSISIYFETSFVLTEYISIQLNVSGEVHQQTTHLICNHFIDENILATPYSNTIVFIVVKENCPEIVYTKYRELFPNVSWNSEWKIDESPPSLLILGNWIC